MPIEWHGNRSIPAGPHGVRTSHSLTVGVAVCVQKYPSTAFSFALFESAVLGIGIHYGLSYSPRKRAHRVETVLALQRDDHVQSTRAGRLKVRWQSQLLQNFPKPLRRLRNQSEVIPRRIEIENHLIWVVEPVRTA